YWLPNIQILEPNWLKEKLVKTLENYLAMARSPDNHVISIT
ncbi:WYL domain-containing protein, partial [Enterobacter kobei]